MQFMRDPAACRIVPFGVYLLMLAIDPWLVDAIASAGGDARWSYGLRIGLVVFALAIYWRDYEELRLNRRLGARYWLLSVVLGLAVFAIWIFPYPPWADLGNAGRVWSPLTPYGGIDWSLVIFRILGAALIVPVMEELFWRSFLMRWLVRADFALVDPARAGVRALLISSALFAVEHTLWLAGLFAGLVYGWLYIVTRNLWAPIAAHAVTNGVLGVWVVYTGAWEYW